MQVLFVAGDITPVVRNLVIPVVLGMIVSVLCVVSGPLTFDGMDGPEFAVAGQRLEICHSPGYPLFMWLLRVSGGRDYNSLRVFGCLIAGLAASGVYFAVKSYGIGTEASAAVSLVLVSSGAVMSQLNILEVHGLSLLLASVAIASRKTQLGSYAMGMSVFGGHPLSILLFPMVINRRWLRTWPLALLPATMWLYVPLRSGTASLMHYGVPNSMGGILHYMTMYTGRVSGISVSGLWESILSLGPVTVVYLVVTGWFGRFKVRFLFVLAGVLLVFLFYGIPDVQAYFWLLMLPLSIVFASGLQRLLDRHHLLLSLLMLCFTVASVVTGTIVSWDKRGNAMHIIASDMLRGIPFERVLCAEDAMLYYSAYLIGLEDRRPDLLAIDKLGVIYPFSRLTGPLSTIPPEFAGRYVYATGAWGQLPPSGLVFSVEGTRLNWEKYDVFSTCIQPTEHIACDIMAELWALRAVQEDNHAAVMAAFEKAQEFTESEVSVNAVSSLMNSYSESSR